MNWPPRPGDVLWCSMTLATSRALAEDSWIPSGTRFLVLSSTRVVSSGWQLNLAHLTVLIPGQGPALLSTVSRAGVQSLADGSAQ